MVARTARSRNDLTHDEIAGPVRTVDRWLCPQCDAAECEHPRWEANPRDPHFGHAMAWLSCGHRASGNRRVMEERGMSTLRCITCIPGHWIVHIREVERIRLAERRANKAAQKPATPMVGAAVG